VSSFRSTPPTAHMELTQSIKTEATGTKSIVAI
jgi:hypothetical protein